MTLAALQKYYKKVATWCVQHWRWLVFASAALIAYFLGRKNSKSLRAQAESALEQYKKESEMLEKEHKDKKEKLDSANRKYTLALKELDKKYDDDSSKLRSSTGLAIDWYTPVGPLNFSFSQPLTKKDTDKTESFRFNLGTTF